MNYYKIPIIEKIYEAYSAIADNRISAGDNIFYAESSDHAKKYTITKTENSYISNDNMSYFMQTLGYPIIATMMLEGKIEYNGEVANYFKNINWKKINTEFKNDYVKAAEIILNQLKESGIDVEFVKAETEKVYSQIKELKLLYTKSKIFPPK